MDIRCKRVYDPPEAGDGRRVLVDRVWPRGVRKADVAVDAWERDLAPTSELRRWFGHDPQRWERFHGCYRAELAAMPDALDRLLAQAGEGPLTLVFAARDREHNNAVVLRDVLWERLAGRQENPGSSPVCYAADFPAYNGLDGRD
ncbi:DUF488 domain-containing protein [Aquisalimonas asiatica]|uniref:Uncharacterized conserved protein YeaO, DUF488 family n=1 Tax=Aquisalimonas asiatica TaxID=406100 RepID=A0A1H8VAL1_9GAMM|nr:DUF488 domain-containing protein [Aquisalimonas asiatica]SEP12502.1 Uncharacterized conserved protein YeaO, DUF488 family [Aquisalimonas asiatica]